MKKIKICLSEEDANAFISVNKLREGDFEVQISATQNELGLPVPVIMIVYRKTYY